MVYKQVGYKLYSTLSYVISVVIVHLPLAAAETISALLLFACLMINSLCVMCDSS